MTADRLARAFVDRVRRDLMNGRPAWLAELQLREIELWVSERLEPALEEQFELGWRERGWHKEEHGDDDTADKH